MNQVTQEAEVIAVDQGRAWVKACDSQGCASCGLAGGCGQGLLSRWLSASQPLLEVESQEPLQVGDRVQLGVDASTLNRAAWLQFALPLVTLLLASLAAEFLGFSAVLHQLLFASLGLTAGLLLARRYAGQSKPVLIQKILSKRELESSQC
ncbi:SoxR reducing system RseC family protein [Marinospirillum sp.]|uniref:SoxR reducing system RseC family protein n=1 Tax=Marinospirillum sp. TaxID=2183934 RepID=UPI00287073E8|nr:SoxR reducing system RseC family protein [Marinospirillum sp.]MDR9467633.1 SoxR reducing system RseC family protein [Marinospirillum sp.]